MKSVSAKQWHELTIAAARLTKVIRDTLGKDSALLEKATRLWLELYELPIK